MSAIKVNWKRLKDTPPWEWPDDAEKMLVGVLRDARSTESDLVLAIELSGNCVVISDTLVAALLSILRSRDRADVIRGAAAIALGPVLEEVDTMEIEDLSDGPITESTFRGIQESLRALFHDADIPGGVRRCILEASVRAGEEWHPEAVRAAFASDDEGWRLTAVFCMRFVGGFEKQILEALDSRHPDIHFEAVLAAGNWEVDAAFPHIAALVTSSATDKPLLLAAIEALASIRPKESGAILVDLIHSDDEDIVEAVEETMAIADGRRAENDDEDDDDDDDDDPLR